MAVTVRQNAETCHQDFLRLTVLRVLSVRVDDVAVTRACLSRGLGRGDQQALGVGRGAAPGRLVDLDACALQALVDGDGSALWFTPNRRQADVGRGRRLKILRRALDQH